MTNPQGELPWAMRQADWETFKLDPESFRGGPSDLRDAPPYNHDEEIRKRGMVRHGPAESRAIHWLTVCFDDRYAKDGQHAMFKYLRTLAAEICARRERDGQPFAEGKRDGEVTGLGYLITPQELQAETIFFVPNPAWAKEETGLRGENNARVAFKKTGKVTSGTEEEKYYLDFHFVPFGETVDEPIETKAREVHQGYRALFIQVAECNRKRKYK